MMKSINRLLFVRRRQGGNLLLFRTQWPICPAHLRANRQQFNQLDTQ